MQKDYHVMETDHRVMACEAQLCFTNRLVTNGNMTGVDLNLSEGENVVIVLVPERRPLLHVHPHVK